MLRSIGDDNVPKSQNHYHQSVSLLDDLTYNLVITLAAIAIVSYKKLFYIGIA